MKKQQPIIPPGSVVLYPKKRPRKRRMWDVDAVIGDWCWLFPWGGGPMRWVKIQHLRLLWLPDEPS